MEEAQKNRLFFALLPPDSLRPAISATAQALQAEHRFGGRLLKPERFHITLFFFGEHQPPETEPDILKAAEAITSPPFELCLDKAGCFPNRDIATWLGPQKVPHALEHLGKQLKDSVSYLSRERNSGFVPHLTIGREAVHKLKPVSVEPIGWRVDEFVLIRSILHEYPARYEILGRYPLTGAALPAPPEQTGFAF
ncbi:MAG: RNA 2',3'-cyclic phosphodiesterase [Nevskiales bacterium]